MAWICISLMTNNVEHVHVFLSSIFFAEVSVQICCPFFTKLFDFFPTTEFESSFYVVDMSSFSDLWFANILSQSVSYLFIYSVFQKAEFLNIDEVEFIIFFGLVDYILVLYLRNCGPNTSSQQFLMIFFLEVLGFTYRSVIHFELIFVYNAWYLSRFIGL